MAGFGGTIPSGFTAGFSAVTGGLYLGFGLGAGTLSVEAETGTGLGAGAGFEDGIGLMVGFSVLGGAIGAGLS